MACIELSIELQAELIRLIQEAVIAAGGDKERASEIFSETVEQSKGLGWLARIMFDGIVQNVGWQARDLINIEFTPAFTSKHWVKD